MNSFRRRIGNDDHAILVIADHGEAFYQHGQSGHASELYDENLHIPLLLINPNLFNGQRISTIGGIIDLAPTLLQIAKIPIPSNWQGDSLLNTNRSEKTFFFAPWSDYLFGARIGPHKIILDETNGSIELYDLSEDPMEKQDRSSDYPELVQTMRHEVAAWIQTHSRMLEKMHSTSAK